MYLYVPLEVKIFCNRYLYQIITLYALNFYNVICQLYLNKDGQKKKLRQIVAKKELKAEDMKRCFSKEDTQMAADVWKDAHRH